MTHAHAPRTLRRAGAAALLAAAACGDEPTARQGGDAVLRVINGGVAPVSVVVDGRTALGALAPGTISPALAVAAGGRLVELRGAAGAVSSVQVAATPTDTPIVAVRQLGGRTEAAVLADTGRLVPAGASKLRVVHMAASAPPLDVWRTQPDFSTPITIAFPFPYAFASSYVQSRPGTWEVRVSRAFDSPDGRPTPGGWDRALARLVVPVPERQARTVVILDAPGGGVRLALLDEP